MLTDHRILADILRLVNKYRPKSEEPVPIVLKCDGDQMQRNELRDA